ncbi:ribosomal protein S18-alanine N-acetyltransferase [Kingella bonacorsii]|jgi:ribosomal-protein-alanine acetyltransferase|uniref:[Ribosomal protein bS18]-alanine N-acetyltransferase n=1 Tax=Kingella bonacorsii TaxID=2796361 RepID=A0ABS1BRJ3_9NEIS|nr:ribosomal protein S18-alanine N-acetyltransferase [Kingella bonacorsii]MBK0395915.1 ribosomal protein S18-alanine N-acetyltransferase [Kingella bonacorsii]
MHIRPATVADIPALASLDQQTNPHPWTANQFQAAHQPPIRTLLIAERDQQIIGYIAWQHIQDEIELHLIATAPSHRQQGIASQLMQQLIATAQQHHARIILEVRASNHIAQALYRKHQFTPIATRKNYYGNEDAIIMEKTC